MINRRDVCAALVLAVLLPTFPTLAADANAFNAKAFEAAQATGKPILVEITAPWCPTCRAQKPILSELFQRSKFKDLVTFEIDFDTQKDLLRTFKVQSQSTLISFHGTKEVDRSVGETRASVIEAQLDKSI